MFEIKLRSVYDFRAIGKGCEADKAICGIMNAQKFLPDTKVLGSTTEEMEAKTMRDGIEEAGGKRRRP